MAHATVRYEARGVLAGAYRGPKGKALVHAVAVHSDGSESVCCGTVDVENLADGHSGPATCLRCRRVLRRAFVREVAGALTSLFGPPLALLALLASCGGSVPPSSDPCETECAPDVAARSLCLAECRCFGDGGTFEVIGQKCRIGGRP